MSYLAAADFLRRMAPTQTHEHRREFLRAADLLVGLQSSATWVAYEKGQVVHLCFPEHRVDTHYRIVDFDEGGGLLLKEVET